MKILSGRPVGRRSLTRVHVRPFLFLGILGFCVGWGYMASATLALSSDFEGLGFGGRFPPDTHGAVGPSHLMVTLNDRVGIQTRAGNMLTTIDLQSFWSPLGVSDVFDPRVVYDPHSGRFIVTTCAERRTAASSVLLAVSATSDPTGNWHMWQFDGDPTDKNWVDYPNVGFSDDKITITANMFDSLSALKA